MQALTVEAIAGAIAQYKAQTTQLQQQIGALDEQRQVAVNTVHQLAGAIGALEQLLQNAHDEEANAPAAPPASTQD